MSRSKIGYLVIQKIKCFLSPKVSITAPIFKRKKIKLEFQYDGIDHKTGAAEIVDQDEQQQSRFGDEQIIIPVVGDETEVRISVYDARKLGYEGRLGENTFHLTSNNKKVEVQVISHGKRSGEILFNVTFLSMNTPSDDMMRIHAEAMRSSRIGMILLENIKVTNLNGKNSHLDFKLNSDHHSTKKYWSTSTKDKELKVALPLICNPNPSLKIQVNYGIERGTHELFFIQFGDIWRRMINGDVATVGELRIFSAGEMCARLSFDMSCHCIVTPGELFSIEREHTDFEDPVLEPEPEPEPVVGDPGLGESSFHVNPSPQSDRFTDFEPQPIDTMDNSPPRATESPLYTSEVPISSSPRNRSASPSQSSIRTRTSGITPRTVCQRFKIVSTHQRRDGVTTAPFRNRLSQGKHIYTSCEVIIKEVFSGTSFDNETKWLKKLQSEWVVKWMDVDPNGCIIITENHGPSLDSICGWFRQSEDILKVCKSITEGVKFMHDKHVVHLDLCPSNIICRQKSSRNRREAEIRICDFEHSRECGNTIQLAQNFSQSPRRPSIGEYDPNQNQQAFTIGFVAPELLGITDDLDEQTSSSMQQNNELAAEYSMDIFALSGIFYFLWVKKLMYRDIEDLRMLLKNEFARVEQDINNEGVANMILRMSKGPPDDRYDVSDVLEDLRGLTGGGRRKGTEDRDDD